MQSQQICPLCQSANGCALAQADDASHCWCMKAKIAPDILAQIPAEQRNISCICQACASTQAKSE